MSIHGMLAEINRHFYLFATVRYPWLRNMPNTWPMLIKFLKDYRPTINPKIVKWNPHINGFYKYNNNGASKET